MAVPFNKHFTDLNLTQACNLKYVLQQLRHCNIKLNTSLARERMTLNPLETRKRNNPEIFIQLIQTKLRNPSHIRKTSGAKEQLQRQN
jgi:hypothetical protein